MEEKLLVRKALAGDQAAFGKLVERHQSWVFAKIAISVKKREDVEDLVQMAFCRAFEQLHRLRSHEHFAPWLGRIAANITTSWWRREQSWSRLVDAGKICDERRVVPPDEAYERAETSQWVDGVLAQMPSADRRTLEKFYYEGYSYKDIAAAENLTVSCVHMRLAVGRKKLRRHFRRAASPLGAYR